MANENKRLFFAFEVQALWPDPLPKGRMLQSRHRHLTIAFLGNIDRVKFFPYLSQIPTPPLKVGQIGTFDRILFLPSKRSNVAAYHINWIDTPFDFETYQRLLVEWLTDIGVTNRLHKEVFLPHVTICRRPFSKEDWLQSFKPFPLFISNFHLYESSPGLVYEPIWTHPILPPFNDQYVFGENIDQLNLHKEWIFPQKQAHSHYPLNTTEGILTCPIK